MIASAARKTAMSVPPEISVLRAGGARVKAQSPPNGSRAGRRCWKLFESGRNRCAAVKTLRAPMQAASTRSVDCVSRDRAHLTTSNGSAARLARRWGSGVLALLALVASGCEENESRDGAPPAPDVVGLNSPCESLLDKAPTVTVGLPERAAGHCIDPTTDVRSYGTGAPASLEMVCRDLFGGECDLYRSHGLESVKVLRYAPMASSSSSVSVVVSRFRTSRGAFGFFTHRTFARGAASSLEIKPLPLRGQGAIGEGIAYVRRGNQLVELRYVSDTETPAEIAKRSPSVLVPLARAIAESLGGNHTPPSVAQRVTLPSAKPLSTQLRPDGFLGLVGTGPYAIAHYDGPEYPHRLVVIEAVEEPGARDALNLMKTAGRYHKLKGRDVFSVRVARQNAPAEVWLFRQVGKLLLGVGPAATGTVRAVGPQDREAMEERWAAFCLSRLRRLQEHALSIDS